jgi:hypothetical protein
MEEEKLQNEPEAICLDDRDRQVFAHLRRCYADAIADGEKGGNIHPESPLFGFEENILPAIQKLDHVFLNILLQAFEELFEAYEKHPKEVEPKLLRLFKAERLLAQVLKQQFSQFQNIFENVDALLTTRPKRNQMLINHLKQLTVCELCKKEPARFKDMDAAGRSGIYCLKCAQATFQ